MLGAMYRQKPSKPISAQSVGIKVIGAIVLFGILVGLAGVWRFVELAARQNTALESLERAKKNLGQWIWTETEQPKPRLLEASRREEITSHYQQALQELGYASQSGDFSGLKTYFEAGALEDAKLLSSGQQQSTWGHRLRLNFYAPDGATVGFTDQSWIGFIWQERFEIRRQVMDVVMRLSDGNWRVLHWRVIKRQIPQLERTSSLAPEVLSAVRGVNYVGRLFAFGEFWQNFDPQETRSSFRLAKTLGLDHIRFFIPYPTPEVVYRHLPVLLELAAAENIQVLPTLLDSYTDYRLEDMPAIHASIERLLTHLGHAAVFAIDVKNEAERDAQKATWRNVRGVLGYLAYWLAQSTKKPITAGLSDPDPILTKSLDFVTVHHYGTVAQLQPRLEKASQYGKPVLLQEFGFHTQIDAFPDPHTEAEQAQYIVQTLALLKRMQVGFLIWNLHDFSNGSVPGNRTVERHLGLVRADNSLKLAALALLGQPVNPPTWLDRLSKFQVLLRFWWVIGLVALGMWFGIQRLKSANGLSPQ
jgi:hypothetical protein